MFTDGDGIFDDLVGNYTDWTTKGSPESILHWTNSSHVAHDLSLECLGNQRSVTSLAHRMYILSGFHPIEITYI